MDCRIIYGIPQIGVVVKDSKKKLFLDRWVNGLRHYGKREFTAEQSMELSVRSDKDSSCQERTEQYLSDGMQSGGRSGQGM